MSASERTRPAAIEDIDPGDDPAADTAPAPVGMAAEAIRLVSRRVIRAWNFAVMVPLSFAILGAETVRSAQEQRQAARPPSPPRRFRRPTGMPSSRADRSVSDIVRYLRSVPMRPRRESARSSFARSSATDGVAMLLDAESALARLGHNYPGVFRSRPWTGADGVRLAGSLAMQDGPAPAIVLCHGLMASRYVGYMHDSAVRAYRRWGFHVVMADLRGYGQSAWTTDAPISGGPEEARDLLEIVRGLREDPRVLSVGVLGFSAGGTTALNVARLASDLDPELIDGGVMSVCAPTDVQEGLDYISRRPPARHPFFMPFLIFNACLRAAVRRRGYRDQPVDWNDAIDRYAAPYYGRSRKELTEQASALNWAQEIAVPTLVLHARDDFVVPVEHADRLAEAARDNPDVAVMTVSRGNHCSFAVVDGHWWGTVTRRWFEYWANEA